MRSLLRAVLLLAMGASTVWAHPMPQSIVLLDFRPNGVAAELQLPLDRLEIGFGRPLAATPAASLARERAALLTYIAARIGATGVDGRTWRVVVHSIVLSTEHPAQHLVATVTLEAPAGADARRFTLHYDVIQRELVTHQALVSVRSDWAAGAVSGPPVVLGTMGYGALTLDVQRPDGSEWQGLQSVFRLGVQHIAEGTDHLLFLLVLLLPASLVARSGRWAEYAGARRSIMQLLKIVSAFTIGHSMTLAAASTGWFRAPGQAVEVLIALSIFVSALHALKPLFAGREAWIAAGFGLVHGLAFAGVIATFGLDRWHAAQAILGFNAGIEVMQVAVVAATVPWLLLLARAGWLTPVRRAGAAVAGVAALGWMGERALGLPNPVAPLVESVATNAGWVVMLLAVLAGVASSASTLGWNSVTPVKRIRRINRIRRIRAGAGNSMTEITGIGGADDKDRIAWKPDAVANIKPLPF